MPPCWRPRPARQARARFSSPSMFVSVRSRSQLAARRSALSALARNAGGPHHLPQRPTAAPTAVATVTGQRGQPATPNSRPMAAGIQYGAQAHPLLAVR
eukprot:10747448-Alexandrium_andersonii.AAC.1